MLSVPLTWNDRVVGVINVQTRERRRFTPEEIEFLSTIAALLGGIVEKGRLQEERERQLETLTALDVARAELLSMVTHELRTPLAIVHAYLDLLGEAALGIGDPPRASAAGLVGRGAGAGHAARSPGRRDPRRGPARRRRRARAAAVRRGAPSSARRSTT